jgi:LmbE family N-acetylglucosaminyl deacetylase
MIFWNDGGVNHTDHRTAGIAAVDAVYPASRNPMAFPWLTREGLVAHRVRRLYLFWTERPSVRIDVSATVSRKIAALHHHASQIQDFERLEARLTEWAAAEGKKIGVEAADAFRLIVIDDDEDEGPSNS